MLKGDSMNLEQLDRMQKGKGFIAALDQSGGSTPKALQLYGIEKVAYQSEEEMFDLVHKMRERIMTSPAFCKEFILGAILFENTLSRDVDGIPTANYLWERKRIIPFLKIDNGLEAEKNGVQLMKPLPGLKDRLQAAIGKNIFGTKMRSVIKNAHTQGITEVVEQQFDIAKQILSLGLIPIIEPEVDIFSADQYDSEKVLLQEVCKHLKKLPERTQVIFKFSLPAQNGFYNELLSDKHVLRIVALSGGYSRAEANDKLSKNPGVIASFSRALTHGLKVQQNSQDFDELLSDSIQSIFTASVA